MKPRTIKYLIALIFILGMNVFSQEKVAINLNVFEPLPEVSFAAFLTNPFLEGTPRILQITMTPHGKMVIVKGSIGWKKFGDNSFHEMIDFTTKPFTSRDFYNDDFSSIDGIDIDESNRNSDLLDENIKIGKPSGTYRISIQVFDENMDFQDEASSDLDFLNPAQTLSIIQPSIGDVLDIAGIQVSWNAVSGVSEYIVKANTRSSRLESLENALQKGNPLVDNRSVGLSTSVNLRDILDRELIGGEEIVLQVRGVIPAPGGPTAIYSDIINFRLRSSSSPVIDKGIEDIESLITDVIGRWRASGYADSEAIKRLQQLLDDLQNGNLDFNNVNIRFDNGQQLSYDEFQQIITYLRQNPDLLTNISFTAK